MVAACQVKPLYGSSATRLNGAGYFIHLKRYIYFTKEKKKIQNCDVMLQDDSDEAVSVMKKVNLQFFEPRSFDGNCYI